MPIEIRALFSASLNYSCQSSLNYAEDARIRSLDAPNRTLVRSFQALDSRKIATTPPDRPTLWYRPPLTFQDTRHRPIPQVVVTLGFAVSFAGPLKNAENSGAGARQIARPGKSSTTARQIVPPYNEHETGPVPPKLLPRSHYRGSHIQQTSDRQRKPGFTCLRPNQAFIQDADIKKWLPCRAGKLTTKAQRAHSCGSIGPLLRWRVSNVLDRAGRAAYE